MNEHLSTPGELRSDGLQERTDILVSVGLGRARGDQRKTNLVGADSSAALTFREEVDDQGAAGRLEPGSKTLPGFVPQVASQGESASAVRTPGELVAGHARRGEAGVD